MFAEMFQFYINKGISIAMLVFQVKYSDICVFIIYVFVCVEMLVFFIINVFVCVNSSLGGSEGRGTTYNAFLEMFSFRSVCSEKSTMVGL